MSHNQKSQYKWAAYISVSLGSDDCERLHKAIAKVNKTRNRFLREAIMAAVEAAEQEPINADPTRTP